MITPYASSTRRGRQSAGPRLFPDATQRTRDGMPRLDGRFQSSAGLPVLKGEAMEWYQPGCPYPLRHGLDHNGESSGLSDSDCAIRFVAATRETVRMTASVSERPATNT